jgi:CheY-like chemotaxis protein
VVSTILERHGYEPALASDGEDAMQVLKSGEVKADLVLLDFVMPRMNGYQFCRALRENAELAMTPVVLMSAKSDRIRDQFVQQTGAIDAISKPFDAQALVAVVENALRRVNTEKRQSSARLPEVANDEPEDFDDKTNVDFETKRTHISTIVATKLAHIVSRVLAEKPDVTPGALATILAERLQRDAIVDIVEALRGSEPSHVLAGDMSVVPIGAILQLLSVESLTGVLVCTSSDAEVSATFRNGLVDLVQSNGAGAEFRLGRFFVEEGLVTPGEIDEVLRSNGIEPREPSPAARAVAKDASPDTVREDPHARSTLPGALTFSELVSPSQRPSQRPIEPAPIVQLGPRLLGAMLLEARKISEVQLRIALSRQSSELLYEVIRWPKGRFLFRREPASFVVESARLGLPVASVVMEGFRRVDEWRVLERTIGSFDTVLVKDELALGSIDASKLDDKEKKVLDAIDGERSVRAVIAASHLSSFDGCRVIVQFLEARVIRKRA